MAGPYSHVIACQMASGSKLLPRELGKLLNIHHCFLLLGSVSPDLPSIWDKVPLPPGDWSDKMHRDPGTNKVVIEAFHRFQAVPDDDPGLAWLLGYVGHVVADVVVHPVVAAIKAAHPGKNIHQIIEIHQDALCFKEVKHYDLKKEFFLEWLAECDSPKYGAAFDQTMSVWETALKKAFGSEPSCKTWYTTYLGALHAASAVSLQFRGYTFPQVSDISEQDKKNFYTDVILPLPQKPTGSFRRVVLKHAAEKIAEVWKAVWDCRKNGGNIAAVVPDWNLNTGENRDTGKENDLW
jgi:hypothetical protein